MNYRPIFIAGCDRSGTTLLGDMLGNAQWTVTTPESQFIHDMVIQAQLGSFESSESAASWLLNQFRYTAWSMPLDLEQLSLLIDLDDLRKTTENLIASYTQKFHPGKKNADVWIDHTPDNFKYQPILKSLFPDARFIHIVRDGRAVCSSIKSLDWGPNNAYTASRHWADRLQEAITVEIAEGENCLRVHFEDLLKAPAQVLERVCQFIDVPYDPAMLNGGGLVLPEFTRSQHRLIGRPPQSTQLDQWRKKLSNAEIRDFESYPLSHTLLTKMGYQPVSKEPTQLSAFRTLGRYCHEFFHYILHRSRHRRMEHRAVSRYKKNKEVNNQKINQTQSINSSVLG